ncbi:MAG: DUF6807 family protein [Balneolales bacterium]
MIRISLAGLSLLLSTLSGSAQELEPHSYTVTVSAGAFDRVDAIVSFSLPDHLDDGVYVMEGNSNDPVHLQVVDNKGRFILEYLNAGDSKTYSFRAESESGGLPVESVTKNINSPSISFKAAGKDVLSYFYNESEPPEGINPRFRRSGYINPVYTPEGVRVTQHFNPHRPHQYGIWSAWYRTEFQGRAPEFWGAHEDNGRVEADTLEAVWEGPVYGGFRARHRFVDYTVAEPKIALNEQWEVYVYQSTREGKYHIFDINITQTANTHSPVEIHEHIYGGINIRGHDDWDGEGEMNFLSSEGYNREKVVGQRVRWSHMGGDVDGNYAGIGILGHPDNPNHPFGVFINDTEPFFSYGPVSLGDLTIEPDAPWFTRYRIITHDGEPDTEELEQLWNDYAYPPAVTVTRND